MIKTNILIIIPSLRIGGAEKVVCNISDNINTLINNLSIITLSDDIPLYETIKNNKDIKVYSCHEPNNLKFPWISIKAVMRFYRLFRIIKPDIVHSHLWGIHCIYLYALMFVFPKPKLVATIHSAGFIYTSSKFLHKLFRLVENTAYRIFRFNLVSISESVDEMVRHKLYYKTLHRIDNGVETNVNINEMTLFELKDSLRLGESYPILIHVGRGSDVKRQIDIIDAMPIILVNYPQARLLLVGRENSMLFGQRINELGIENSVMILDERNDVTALLQLSDIGIFPSLYEGLPLALLEMMAAGLPLVVSDIPILKEVTEFGKAALYVSVKNPEEIAMKIKELLANPTLMNRLSSNARQIVVEKYSVKKMGNDYEKLYYSIS